MNLVILYLGSDAISICVTNWILITQNEAYLNKGKGYLQIFVTKQQGAFSQ